MRCDLSYAEFGSRGMKEPLPATPFMAESQVAGS